MCLLDKVKGFDLNLLTVFVAIDEYRHVTQAAKALGLSQPALSHALGRLRLLLQDPLFVKSSQGMVPTPRAVQLSLPVKEFLQTFQAKVLGTQSFHPKQLQRTFRIYTTDLIESLLFPSLVASLEKLAPGVRVISRPPAFSLPKEKLESGECDVAIGGFFGSLPGGFYQQKLFTDAFQIAVRQGHPRLGRKKTITLGEYCAERHILVAPGGQLHGKADEYLKKKKQERVIVAGLNAFLSSAWVLAETDCILSGPSRLLGQLSQAFPLHTLNSPIPIPDLAVVQTWHERNHQDPAHGWFREQVRSVLQKS